jgi:hypothetical protein
VRPAQAAAERVIQEQVDEIERLRSALWLIDRNGCENYTTGRCWEHARARGARYQADAWCNACVAADALKDPV